MEQEIKAYKEEIKFLENRPNPFGIKIDYKKCGCYFCNRIKKLKRLIKQGIAKQELN